MNNVELYRCSVQAITPPPPLSATKVPLKILAQRIGWAEILFDDLVDSGLKPAQIL